MRGLELCSKGLELKQMTNERAKALEQGFGAEADDQ